MQCSSASSSAEHSGYNEKKKENKVQEFHKEIQNKKKRVVRQLAYKIILYKTKDFTVLYVFSLSVAANSKKEIAST